MDENWVPKGSRQSAFLQRIRGGQPPDVRHIGPLASWPALVPMNLPPAMGKLQGRGSSSALVGSPVGEKTLTKNVSEKTLTENLREKTLIENLREKTLIENEVVESLQGG